MPNVETDKTRMRQSLYSEVVLGAHALTNQGADAQVYAGSVRVLTVNPTTEDGFDFELFLPRSVEMDVATVTVTPTVRWTCLTSPAANATVQWKLDYEWATPVLTPNTAAGAPSQFLAAVNTATTAVNTLSGTEYHQHLVTAFPSLSFPARNAAPSMAVIGNVRISSVSTVAYSLFACMGFGLSYLVGPSGTNSIVP